MMKLFKTIALSASLNVGKLRVVVPISTSESPEQIVVIHFVVYRGVALVEIGRPTNNTPIAIRLIQNVRERRENRRK